MNFYLMSEVTANTQPRRIGDDESEKLPVGAHVKPSPAVDRSAASLSSSLLPRAARQCIRAKRSPLATMSEKNDSADAAAMPIPMAVM
jgi:hypothetical protein